MDAFAEGTPCWVDVSLPDLEAGKRFYGELFGWTFGRARGMEDGHYTVAFSGGKRVAGLVAKRDGRMPTVWTIYFATPDADALSVRIREAGGQMVREPLAVGRFGVMALAADPAGAVFGLWQAGEDLGFEKTGLPGSFCWTEVYTRDKERVDPFYETVFGFRGRDLPGDDVDFRLWSPAGSEPGPGSAIGGRSVITDAFPAELPGHFLSYFSVDDCDETAETVVRLGGRVTAPPFDIDYGRMAGLLDNQGAYFAVLAEPKREPERAPEPAAGEESATGAESGAESGAAEGAAAAAEPAPEREAEQEST
ncbi:VOC family protein [Streptomyces scopuliridis]|uniref:VOC family protein n=1 Tax=Streptomyces scopuliridis TaxID=452529 RepID=A0ACD4ZNZ0_9ACTN|nr:VOC family protein [Streptomyces scopuliridis]WSB35273.1 VOC family protein [Streptomyces scopuliridis]WSB99516.1 VOC family protein [Streptomyces scopuliridis]WSC06784.1 VOC family protein [Streptomyces scopuliridis]